MFLTLLLGNGLPPLAVFGLATFCGGSLSNWLDRVAFNKVVDFLNFALAGIQPYIFNLADVAIGLGMTLTALSILLNITGFLFRKMVEMRR